MLNSVSEFLDRNMYLTSNTAYIDCSQPPSVNQGGSGHAGAEIHVPPTYEAIQDPLHGPRAGETSDGEYEVLDTTPGEPRNGPPNSQVTLNAVGPHHEMFEPSIRCL